MVSDYLSSRPLADTNYAEQGLIPNQFIVSVKTSMVSGMTQTMLRSPVTQSYVISDT